MSRLPATEAEFHERYPAPVTIRTADRNMLALSGSRFRAGHLIVYRVLEERHPQPIAASPNLAEHAALFAALQMFPSNRALVAAYQYAPAGLVATGGFLNFYSLLAPLLQAGERHSAPAQAVIQRRAQVARTPAASLRRTEFVSGSGLGLSSPAQLHCDLPSSSPYTPTSHVLSTASVQMDRVGPEAMTQHLVSAFLTGVLGMRDDPPLRRLVFLPAPRRMRVDTCRETFFCVDDGGFAFAVGDGRRYAALECKRQWDLSDEGAEEEGAPPLEETLDVAGQHVAELLGMAAWQRPNDGEGWEDAHKRLISRGRFFLVAANQYHLQLKRVDFTPEYLLYVLGNRVAQRPARAWCPPPARRNYRPTASPTEEESASNWGPPSTPGGSSSVNTSPCVRPQTVTDLDDAQMTDSEQKDDDSDDGEPKSGHPDDHENLPFMTVHSGPIHNLSTPDGRVSAAREILALAEELESWI
ncbi:hypothetical protein FN846DRAFT_895522 [Sphaerosporella brunnea]|uniref:Uncharacterized protein n=1 Tax=Sphaerosporella brunnea TaxID=1250544 RepID=A0A5J5EG72_9PEZI|nr:hypothetical protein FN846DRAFT_895522 [Sphaerosporella brunnea]